jgi:predicted metal-dependent phosphoesterase TrpH
VEGGHCYNLDEAFRRYLKKGRPAWAHKAKMSAAEAINMIHVAGGVAVMAHPGITRMNEVIPDLVAGGLDGLECFYTRHSTAMTEHYLMCAERHDLLVTGGSDCHGDSKGEPLIGRVKLPCEFVEKLKSAAAAMV